MILTLAGFKTLSVFTVSIAYFLSPPVASNGIAAVKTLPWLRLIAGSCEELFSTGGGVDVEITGGGVGRLDSPISTLQSDRRFLNPRLD